MSIKDNEGRSLLEYAGECDNLQLFDFVYNSFEHTLENIVGALYNAVACGRIENVKYLIEKMIDDSVVVINSEPLKVRRNIS